MIVGQGLHGGRPGSVRLRRHDGPTVIRRGARVAPLSSFRVRATDRSTTIAAGDLAVETVEHLFAALAAYGAHHGVAVELEGDEIPLADGGARAFADAVRALAIAPSAPALRVARRGEIVVQGCRYVFEPGDRVAVEVAIDFGDARLAPRARWDGDPEDFRVRVAPARTFGFEREVAALLDRGLASHVSPESVVLLGEGRVLCAGRPFEADEPARHKLVDLIGDLFVHGGPPLGSTFAECPGHAATHEAVRRGMDEGLVLISSSGRARSAPCRRGSW